MNGGIVLYGAAYSVYVRAVRLALEEKGLAYRLEEIDIFAPEKVPSGYAARHPFGKIPAFEHDGLALYESDAIQEWFCRGHHTSPVTGAAQQMRMTVFGCPGYACSKL